MRRGDYGRDPLDILIERENGTCKGCKHELIVFDRRICDRTPTSKHGKRCKHYNDCKRTTEEECN